MGANSSKSMRKDVYGNWYLDYSFDVLFGDENSGNNNHNDDPEYEEFKLKPYSFIEHNNEDGGDEDDEDNNVFPDIVNGICNDEKNFKLTSMNKEDDLQSYPEISRNIVDQAIIIINIAPEDIDLYNKSVPYDKKAVLMGHFNEPKTPYYMIRRKSNCPDIFDRPIPGQVKRFDTTNGFCYAAGCSIVVNYDGKVYGIFHKDYTKSFETCLGGCASRDDWKDCVDGKITPSQFYLDTALREVEEETTGVVKGRKIKGINFEKYNVPLNNICEVGYNQKYFDVDNLDDTYRMFGAVINLDSTRASSGNLCSSKDGKDGKDSKNYDPFFDHLFDPSNYCPVSRTFKLCYEKSDLNSETEYVCARELIVEDVKNENNNKDEQNILHLRSFLQQIKEHKCLLESDKINRSVFALLGTHLNLRLDSLTQQKDSKKRKRIEFDQVSYLKSDLKDYGFPPRMVYYKPLLE